MDKGEITFTTGISEKVFRIRELSLNFNTVEFKTGEFNKSKAVIGVSDSHITFQNFKNVNFNNIIFMYDLGISEKRTERGIIELKNMLPGAGLSLNNSCLF